MRGDYEDDMAAWMVLQTALEFRQLDTPGFGLVSVTACVWDGTGWDWDWDWVLMAIVYRLAFVISYTMSLCHCEACILTTMENS